jgi:hypothetical protein
MRKWLYARRQRRIDNLARTIEKLSDLIGRAEPGSFDQAFIEVSRANAFERRNKLVAKQHKETQRVRA